MLYDAAIKRDFDIAKGGSIVIHEKTGKKEDRAKLNDSIRMGLRNNLPLYTTFVFGSWVAIYRKSLFDDGMVRYGTQRHSQDKLPLVWQQLHCLDTKTRRMVLRSLPRSFLSLALKSLWKKRLSFSKLFNSL